MQHEDWVSLAAMNWAVETLDTASNYLTLAAVFARGAAVRSDAKLLAAAVEHELAALCETLDRYT
jgi:glycine cleavage system regulatory protein